MRFLPVQGASHELGSAKPDHKIYLALEEQARSCGMQFTQVVFFDDIPQYCQGANEYGWDAIEFRDAAQAEQELLARNIVF